MMLLSLFFPRIKLAICFLGLLGDYLHMQWAPLVSCLNLVVPGGLDPRVTEFLWVAHFILLRSYQTRLYP